MSDFAEIWRFSRYRLNEATKDLTHEQLSWRPHKMAHTIYEMLYHVAGAEHYWACRFAGRDPVASEFEAKLDVAVKDGFLRDGACPFGEHEMNREAVSNALAFSMDEIAPVFDGFTAEQRAMQLVSPFGDEVTGEKGLARLAHAGYHTGQIWLMRMDPRFP